MAHPSAPPLERISVGTSGRSVAFRHLPGASPALLYVPGYLSRMSIRKAVAMEELARARGLAAVRYDMGGTGKSDGK